MDFAALQNISLPVLSWAAEHASILPTLTADAQAIESAEGVEAKWTAAKKFGDDAVGALVDFPGLSNAGTDGAALKCPLSTPAVVEAHLLAHPAVKANGVIIGELIQNLPQIISAITTIIGLFGKAKPATHEP
jgi:hypothetical protein